MKISLLNSKLRLFFILVLSFYYTELAYPQEAKTAKYPTKPITFIVALPPGNPTDLAVRLICKEAEKYLKQPLVVSNKAGGGGSIGTAAIAAGKPDGYTIGFPMRTSMFISPYLEKVPYHPIKDFKQIMQFGAVDYAVAVKANSPFKDLKDIVAYARQNPQKLTYGSMSGISIHGLAFEEVAEREKVEFTHIPFKGTVDAQTALLGGHVLVGLGNFNYSLIESRQIRIVVLLNEERLEENYPGVPILKDYGYDIPSPSTQSIAGPNGLPENVVKTLEEAFTKAMKEPAFVNGMKNLRLPIIYRTGKQMDEYVAQNYEYYGRLLKQKGLIK